MQKVLYTESELSINEADDGVQSMLTTIPSAVGDRSAWQRWSKNIGCPLRKEATPPNRHNREIEQAGRG